MKLNYTLIAIAIAMTLAWTGCNKKETQPSTGVPDTKKTQESANADVTLLNRCEPSQDPSKLYLLDVYDCVNSACERADGSFNTDTWNCECKNQGVITLDTKNGLSICKLGKKAAPYSYWTDRMMRASLEKVRLDDSLTQLKTLLFAQTSRFTDTLSNAMLSRDTVLKQANHTENCLDSCTISLPLGTAIWGTRELAIRHEVLFAKGARTERRIIIYEDDTYARALGFVAQNLDGSIAFIAMSNSGNGIPMDDKNSYSSFNILDIQGNQYLETSPLVKL